MWWLILCWYFWKCLWQSFRQRQTGVGISGIGIKKILPHRYEWASLNLLMPQIEPKGMGCVLPPAPGVRASICSWLWMWPHTPRHARRPLLWHGISSPLAWVHSSEIEGRYTFQLPEYWEAASWIKPAFMYRYPDTGFMVPKNWTMPKLVQAP